MPRAAQHKPERLHDALQAGAGAPAPPGEDRGQRVQGPKECDQQQQHARKLLPASMSPSCGETLKASELTTDASAEVAAAA